MLFYCRDYYNLFNLSPVCEYYNQFSIPHLFGSRSYTFFYCTMTELFNMGDLTFLGGSLWLTYYCHYHNNSIANSSKCFSMYDLTFVARPNL